MTSFRRASAFIPAAMLAGIMSQPASAGRISSVYTEIHFSKCRKAPDHGRNMGADFRCPGYKGREIIIRAQSDKWAPVIG